MVIKFNLSALRRTKWYELALRIGFGGLITVATGLIAKRFGPVVGGLFLAFPAIFPASATLVEKHEREKKERAGIDGTVRARNAVSVEARGSIIGCVGLAAFALVVWKFLVLWRPSWLVLLVATVIWLISSVTVWQLRRRVKSVSLVRKMKMRANAGARNN